jgi:hypothetical protein
METQPDPERTGPETMPAAAAAPVIPGHEVLELLGRGGMGVVYKARHVRLKRLVAVKMIRAGEDAGAQELARFRTEAEAVARLQHPNIVQLYELGEADGPSSPWSSSRAAASPVGSTAGRCRPRRAPASSRSSRGPSSTPTSRASSTATSSRPTCC